MTLLGCATLESCSEAYRDPSVQKYKCIKQKILCIQILNLRDEAPRNFLRGGLSFE